MIVLVRGGGDLASGVALRLFRAGFQIVICELPQPLAVRRTVSFAEAVYQGIFAVEGISAHLVDNPEKVWGILAKGCIPILVDPGASSRYALQPPVIVDGRMTKQEPDLDIRAAPLMIGLGPGFTAGVNCHAVVETKRGHFLGRVYWQGSAMPDTGIPEAVQSYDQERVLRAPADGNYRAYVHIGDWIEENDPIADVEGIIVRAPFNGLVRGLLHSGIEVKRGTKIGDIDPRNEPSLCQYVSDKALAVGGGVLEAILSRRFITLDS